MITMLLLNTVSSYTGPANLTMTKLLASAQSSGITGIAALKHEGKYKSFLSCAVYCFYNNSNYISILSTTRSNSKSTTTTFTNKAPINNNTTTQICSMPILQLRNSCVSGQ